MCGQWQFVWFAATYFVVVVFAAQMYTWEYMVRVISSVSASFTPRTCTCSVQTTPTGAAGGQGAARRGRALGRLPRAT